MSSLKIIQTIILVSIGLVVTELCCHKINMNTKEKPIIKRILKATYNIRGPIGSRFYGLKSTVANVLLEKIPLNITCIYYFYEN